MFIMKNMFPTIGSDTGNETGSVMLIALLIMALLTIIGVSAINDTSTELQIARNDRIYKINFFQADGSARQAIQMLEDTANPGTNLVPSSSSITWLQNTGYNPEQTWTFGTNAASSDFTGIRGSTAGYSAEFRGIAGGSGKDMTESTNLYEYRVYGRSSYNNGDCMVMTGYRIRF
jgi:type IV pilus assembly protein PilX